MQKEQATSVSAVSARKHWMILFSSGVVMAPRPNHLMYTVVDILPSALAVKDGAGVVPQWGTELCSPAPWRPEVLVILPIGCAQPTAPAVVLQS